MKKFAFTYPYSKIDLESIRKIDSDYRQNLLPQVLSAIELQNVEPFDIQDFKQAPHWV